MYIAICRLCLKFYLLIQMYWYSLVVVYIYILYIWSYIATEGFMEKLILLHVRLQFWNSNLNLRHILQSADCFWLNTGQGTNVLIIQFSCCTCTALWGRRGALWSYVSWIYNYLCNQCLSPLKLWVRTPFMARCTQYNIMC